MSNPDALFEYSESLRRLKKQCYEAGMNDEEFRILYFESLDSFQRDTSPRDNDGNRRKCRVLIVTIVAFVMLCAAYNIKTFTGGLVCNLQDYVYPGLRLLRRLSIPFISLFPSLTDFYHESCLVYNPFFTVVDMDCWPCSTVNNVREIHDPKPVHQQHSAPFIYKTDQEMIYLETLQDMYIKHKDIFDKESSKITVNNKISISPEEIFKRIKKDDKNVFIWRSNNINVARVLRQIILRPKVVPKFGQSTERYLVIDSSQESFPVPDTECNFAFLLLLNGRRIINLVPAEECKTHCKSIKVELKSSYLLWYNWWYWRPVVETSTGNETLIAHVGSYC